MPKLNESVPHDLEEVVKKAQASHDSACELLSALDINGCDVYKSTRVEAIIRRLTKEDTRCPVCKVTYSHGRLKSHIIGQHGGVTYDCNMCEYKAGSKALLKAHTATHTGKEEQPFYCEECDRGFPSRSKYNEHNKKRHPQPDESGQVPQFKCEWCGVIQTLERNLTTHKESCKCQPGGAPKFGCFFCTRYYSARKNRNAHATLCGNGAEFDGTVPNIVGRYAVQQPKPRRTPTATVTSQQDE